MFSLPSFTAFCRICLFVYRIYSSTFETMQKYNIDFSKDGIKGLIIYLPYKCINGTILPYTSIFLSSIERYIVPDKLRRKNCHFKLNLAPMRAIDQLLRYGQSPFDSCMSKHVFLAAPACMIGSWLMSTGYCRRPPSARRSACPRPSGHLPSYSYRESRR